MTENKNAVLGTAKKPYEKPEIEVVNLDSQPQLLAQSAVPSRFGAGFGEDEGNDW
ncbi:MAG: hypothetical protein IJ894_00765 [Bacteroidales bacterium]|jgi:hypothetical protein|nr:hypothetical protein [Bacteroidales bacterium]MBR3711906.1 hypothetical protein [Bacteroidales bacterium]MBR4271973.1 hypothetical protein [Bacteroidales bacterium]